jgi:hypothetical protein
MAWGYVKGEGRGWNGGRDARVPSTAFTGSASVSLACYCELCPRDWYYYGSGSFGRGSKSGNFGGLVSINLRTSAIARSSCGSRPAM